MIDTATHEGIKTRAQRLAEKEAQREYERAVIAAYDREIEGIE